MSPLRIARSALAVAAGTLLLSTTLIPSTPASAASYRTTTVAITKIRVLNDGDGLAGCGEFEINTHLWDGWSDKGVAWFGDHPNHDLKLVDGAGLKYNDSDLCTGQTRSFPNGVAVAKKVALENKQSTFILSATEADGVDVLTFSNEIKLGVDNSIVGTSYRDLSLKAVKGLFWDVGGSSRFDLVVTVRITVKDGK